jgi:epoxyqueuosine reductase QueG
MKLSDHPTVKAYNEHKTDSPIPTAILETANLKQMALDAGVDDAGLIDLSRETMAEYRQDLLNVMPDAKSVMVLVVRLNQTPLRSLPHSVADNEFQQVLKNIKNIERQLVIQLKQAGIKALGMPVGFPMEMSRWPQKLWLTSDKVFASEAGLGQMGYNRLVLHPKFGAAIVFGSILLSADCDQYDRPLEFNPCIECGLCLKVCPTGAVKKTDNFDFIACYSHNYRERLGGFLNWIEQVVGSKTPSEYRRRVSDSETFSMWQNLSIGAQTRCDRCMAVCPAGEASIGEYLDDRKSYTSQYLKKFRNLPETIYVVKGSDAEQHVLSNFPEKQVKFISNGLRPLSAGMFLEVLPRIFQANQSEGLDTVYHFSFTGNENLKGTVTIREKTIAVQEGLVGKPDLHVTADSQTWVKFLAQEANLFIALATRKIKIKGSPKLMKAFAKCFPS